MSTFVQSFHLTRTPPFSGELCSPLTCTSRGSHLIRIKGNLMESNNSFNINLQEGPVAMSPYRGVVHPIALHVSVRPEEDNTIVLNSYDEDWEEEERYSDLNLLPGRPFEIVIICELNHFQIFLNGEHLATFQYRRPVEAITHISVVNRVYISRIERQMPAGSFGPTFAQAEGEATPY